MIQVDGFFCHDFQGDPIGRNLTVLANFLLGIFYIFS
jgi:hypothetical protein